MIWLLLTFLEIWYIINTVWGWYRKDKEGGKNRGKRLKIKKKKKLQLQTEEERWVAIEDTMWRSVSFWLWWGHTHTEWKIWSYGNAHTHTQASPVHTETFNIAMWKPLPPDNLKEGCCRICCPMRMCYFSLRRWKTVEVDMGHQDRFLY